MVDVDRNRSVFTQSTPEYRQQVWHSKQAVTASKPLFAKYNEIALSAASGRGILEMYVQNGKFMQNGGDAAEVLWHRAREVRGPRTGYLVAP